MAARKTGSGKALAKGESSQVAPQIAARILSVLSDVPRSTKRKSRDPEAATRQIANAAAINAAAAAGTLALPPGPLGWLTILPELMLVWKIQAQMVADIAAYHGKTHSLTREQMLYCLFKHTAAQAVRDIAVQVGERVVIQRSTVRTLNRIAQKVGVKVSERALARSASRWLPVVGALGVAGYAYYDTAQVARTATALYSHDIEVQPAERSTTS